jgi:hypothetical protein
MSEQAALTVNNIRTYTLVAGIANAIAFLLGVVVVIALGASTFGCGCLLVVLPLIHLAVCIVDFIDYGRLADAPTPQTYALTRTSAVMDLLACFALVPLIMGILKLQLLNTEDVRAHFNVGPQGGQ